MDMQFVFGNPIRKGGKKPLPNKKQSVKLSKASTKEKCKMAVKKRKATGRKNPVLYSYKTGKKTRRGDAIQQQVGLPIPSKTELALIRGFVETLKKEDEYGDLTKSELKQAIKFADKLGYDKNKIEDLKLDLETGELNADTLTKKLSKGMDKGRTANLKKYYKDITTNGTRYRDMVTTAQNNYGKLKKTLYALNLPEAQELVEDDYEDSSMTVKSGLPNNFYGALANHYRGRKEKSTVKRRKKTRRNPETDFSGLEDLQSANPRRRKKRKTVRAKAKKHTRRGRKAVGTVKRRKRKGAGRKNFTILSKPKKGSGKTWRKVFGKVMKSKRGKITSMGGYKVRRNPHHKKRHGHFKRNPDLVQTIIPGFHGVRPLAVLAGAAAFTGVLNGFIRFGVAKLPEPLKKIVAMPGVALVMPAIGPLAFAALLAGAGRSKYGSKYAATLNEISLALVTVSAVTLGINAFGGLVTNVMKKVFPTALAGYDGSLGLIPEGMAADVDMGDDFSGADFGGVDGDMDGVANFSGADFGDGDFGGVANYAGDMDGVANFSGDNIGDDMGDDMGDADFGGADFGDVDGDMDGDMDGVANFSGPSLG
jgi:hypothetical protein